MNIIIVYSALCSLITYAQPKSLWETLVDRKKTLLDLENQQYVGSNIKLNELETAANKILMRFKNEELTQIYSNPENLKFSKSYLYYRDDINNSNVYKIIRQMPKGGALHLHNSMMLDIDSLMNFTRDPNLYICFGKEYFALLFSKKLPKRSCPGEWGPLEKVRQVSEDKTKFEEDFKQFFALHVRDPDEVANDDLETVWSKFNQVYKNIKTLISYRPVRERYIYQSLQNLYDDNVMYAELRTGLSPVYEIDGKVHDKHYSVQMFKRVTEAFKQANPDFVGVKLIITTTKERPATKVKESLDLAKSFKQKYPDMIAGFDLIGQENKGRPLSDYLGILSQAKNDIEYYLHAGETNWNGMPTDENLFDAVVLDSKRIGHGYALIKHPSLIQAVIDKQIAIEANVISNNVLGLVKDIKNHPLATYLALGLPIVLSSDDPGVWGADPLSHDFYVTFMGVANKNADLRMLKQLALNSITYSSLNDQAKKDFRDIFDKRWQLFIQNVITNSW